MLFLRCRRNGQLLLLSLLLISLSGTSFAAIGDHFVIQIKTDNPGTSSPSSISLPFSGGPYDVDWENDGTFDDFGSSFSASHDYGLAGTYSIRIRGSFGTMSFSGGGDIQKLTNIIQWGSNTWTNANKLFFVATNLLITATDNPDFSAVTDMTSMFHGASLANPLTTNWNTGAVITMANMFNGASSANPDVSQWDISQVNDMTSMFQQATNANPDVSNWNTASLMNTNSMFKLATSAQPDISGWNVASLTNATDMFFLVSLSDTLYDNILATWWATQSLQPNVVFDAGNSSYCSNLAATARNSIISAYNWSINDAGQNCTTADAFITTWNTGLSGSSAINQITVPMVGGPYDVDWDNDGSYDETNLNGPVTHTFGLTGQHTIRISGSFDTIQFLNTDDKLKIISVDQWGTHSWSTMAGAFWGAENLIINAIDTPDLSLATSVQRMFMGAVSLNPDVSNWDVSNIQIFASMFRNASAANPDVGGWHTDAMTGANNMFLNAISFNRDLSGWNISLLTTATALFNGSSLSTGNYDRLLVGWQSQIHQNSVTLGASGSHYCSTTAISARSTLTGPDGWSINDAGPGCSSTPATPPDLVATSDTGVLNQDNITNDNTPDLSISCGSADDVLKVYSDKPALQTLLFTHNCSSSFPETVTITPAIDDNDQTLSYTRSLSGVESPASPGLFVRIDTVPPAGPGNLISPQSSTRDNLEQLIGSCGVDAGGGTFRVVTVPANGYNNTFYSFPRPLFLGGEITMTDPDWNDGSWAIYFDCTDPAGNGPVQFGPFGPVVVETVCDGSNVQVQADFPTGIWRCQGSNSIATSGTLNIKADAVVYFQSPQSNLNTGFTVDPGGIFTLTTSPDNTPPHIFGPTQLVANIGDTVVFSDTQSCDDYEDGNLPINPIDSGVLSGPAGSEFVVLNCTDLNGALIQKQIEIIKN